MHIVCEGRGVRVGFVSDLSDSQFLALMQEKQKVKLKSASSHHSMMESRPPPQVCITPLICIRLSLTWQGLPLPSWQYTHHRVLPQHL